MQPRFGKLGRIAHIEDDKGFLVAVLVALIVVCAVVAGYFAYTAYGLKPEGYSNIYQLDMQQNAADYPQTLVAGQNSTFEVIVGVVNHEGDPVNYQVQVKVTKNLALLPVAAEPSQILDFSNLQNGAIIEKTSTITENTPGSYSVVFELWQKDATGTYVFNNNYCVLNIQVTN
jgi:uncharacterized membrane protein